MAGRILIIDPVATNRIFLRSLLVAAFHDVVLADDWQNAADIVKRMVPDIVVIGSDRFEAGAIDQLKDQAPDAPPLVLAIAADRIEARLNAFDAGADEVVTKPVDQALLLATVRKMMRFNPIRNGAMPLQGLAEAAAAFDAPRQLTVLPLRGGLGFAQQVEARLARLKLRTKLGLPHMVLAPGRSNRARNALVIAVQEGQEQAALTLLREVNIAARTPSLLFVQGASADIAAEALDLGAQDVLSDTMDEKEWAHRIRRLPDPARMPVAPQTAPLLHMTEAGTPSRLAGYRALDFLVQQKNPMAVFLAELSGYKALLKAHGAQRAEDSMKAVADTLRHNLPDTARLFRYAPDSFLMVLPRTGSAEARRLALRLCHIVTSTANPGRKPRQSDSAQLRVGIALFQGGSLLKPPMSETILNQAESALACAKVQGAEPVQIRRHAA